MPHAPPDSPDPDPAALVAARPALAYGPGGLALEGVALAPIADAVGTPCWVYGADTIAARHDRLRGALRGAGLEARIHYAVKANGHLAILRLLAARGAGADVVSGGELRRARAGGMAARDIVFSGVGKSEPDLELALAEGIAQVNVESAEELAMLSAIAARAGRRARVALRVNPDVDAGTHAKITTGLADNKFGIPIGDAPALYAHAATLPGIGMAGLALHIGSQIGDMAPYRAAYARVAALVRGLREAGHAVDSVDCGGGLGISYRAEPEAEPEAFASVIAETLGGLGLSLAIEPGRWLVGPAGVLLARVILTKRNGARRFMVLDAAMTELLRPSMYDAWHGIVPVRPTDGAPAPQDVVGPVCETGDRFARDRLLPVLPQGATVAILDAGAYGAAMSSAYNTRPAAAEAMVRGADRRWAVIRPRGETEALWRDERTPEWIA